MAWRHAPRGQARSGRGGSSHAGAVMVEHLGRPRRRPHPATRPPENAQDRRTGLDPYRGHTPGSARGRRALPTRPRRVHRLEAATERGRGQAKAITRDDFAVILARAGEPRRLGRGMETAETAAERAQEHIAKHMTQAQVAKAQKLSREYWTRYVIPFQ